MIQLGTVRLSARDAATRAVNFALDENDAFLVYDVAGIVARRRGLLSDFGPWSFLLPGAIGGNIVWKDLNATRRSLSKLAATLRSIPDNIDLHKATPIIVDSVKEWCCYNFDGVRSAKVTKTGAAYRPRAIPILDSKIGGAYERDLMYNLSARADVIDALISDVKTASSELRKAQQIAAKHVVHFSEPDGISLLRFCDIVVWTYMRSDARWTQALGAPPSQPRDFSSQVGWQKV